MTDKARNDLDEIERYGRRTWGTERARSYRGLIIKAFAKLMVRPNFGRRQELLVQGLRRLNVRQHAVFYVLSGEDIVIARVLHQRMDIQPVLFEGRY